MPDSAEKTRHCRRAVKPSNVCQLRITRWTAPTFFICLRSFVPGLANGTSQLSNYRPLSGSRRRRAQRTANFALMHGGTRFAATCALRKSLRKQRNRSDSSKMATDINKEIQLEIAYILFVDTVGYSKLSINEQHAVVDELTQIVRGAKQFQKAEAADRLIKISTGDGMALVFYTSPES